MGRIFEVRKSTMFKRFDRMAKAFSRIGKDISIAVKTGSSDPKTNPRLRAAIQNARAVNMPKDNIERAIKKATSKEMDNFSEIVYEGYGPHGIAILVETATDNPIRTVANVRSYFNKYGGSLGVTGSVDYMFEHKCNFKVKLPAGIDIDTLELELIDVGCEEMEKEGEDLILYGTFESFGAIQAYFEKNNFEIISSGFESIPLTTKSLEKEQADEVIKLLDKLEDDDDVQNVYHTMV